MGKGEREDLARLVAVAQAGDGRAFGEIVARYRSTALLIALGVCSDREIAEDATQDAFLTAHRALPNLEDPLLFGPWLATIVRNRARRLAQEGYRLRSRPLSILDGEILKSIPFPSPSACEPGEQAVRALPEGIRESMLLYYFEQWSAGEIAALLERPLTTVKWQLHAGRALLRKRLGGPENLS